MRKQRCMISAFVFATQIVQSLYFLNPKFQAYIHLLLPYSLVCVGPGRKPRRPVFSQRGSNILLTCYIFISFIIILLGNKTGYPLWPCHSISSMYLSLFCSVRQSILSLSCHIHVVCYYNVLAMLYITVMSLHDHYLIGILFH